MLSTAFNRTNEVSADPKKLEATIAFVRDQVAPNLSSQPGYVGLIMGANRMTGGCLVSSNWSSADAREKNNAAVSAQRSQAAEIGGAKPVTVSPGELVVSRVRVDAPAGSSN